jgi:glyoxylase-like metal-dependent hydrolase (beta-lactamase superfamily II)
VVLRIEEHPDGPRTTFVLSGRIESSNVQQLKLQIDRSETDVALDLRQVRIVDRDAVRFLARCETRGIELLDCPPFVRSWIKSEQTANEGEDMSRVSVETPSLPDYAPVPRSALGPAVNKQGYYVGRVERNLYWVTDGVYQAAFLTTKDGVVLLDAPPTIGGNLQRAVDEIATANGVSNKVTHIIYSHHHADHIGASSLFDKDVVRIGHEETKRLLLRDNDPARPVPDQTFEDRRTLKIGGERIELARHGTAHTPDTIFIHLPDHDTLMLVDIILPGWAPFASFNNAEDVPGCIEAPNIALSYPWKHFIGGHIGRLGTRDDLILQQQYVADIVANIKTAIGAVNPVPYFQKYGENAWGGVKEYLDAVTNAAAAPVIKKYTGVLAAADVYTNSTVFLIMESLRLDLGFASQVHP